METNTTTKEHILTTPFISIAYDKQLNAIHATWQGDIISEDAKSGIDQLLSCLKAQNAKSLVMDIRAVNSLPLQGQIYMAEALAGFIKKHYQLKIAHICSKDAFVRFMARHIEYRLTKLGGVEVNRNLEHTSELPAYLMAGR